MCIRDSPYTFQYNPPLNAGNNAYSLNQTTVCTVIVRDPNFFCPQILIATVLVPRVQVVSCVGPYSGGRYTVTVQVIDGQGPYSYYNNGIPLLEFSVVPTFTFNSVSPSDMLTVEDRGGQTGCTMQVNWNPNGCLPPPVRAEQNVTADASEFKLYPNPARDEFTLSYRLQVQDEAASIEIYDAKGAKVFAAPLESASGEQTVDTRSWTEGIYLCRIMAGGKNLSSKKLIISH